MNNKIISAVCALSLALSAIPHAFCANSDFVGSYYAYDTSGGAYTTLNITSCTDSAITIEFTRDKENSTKFTYTCYDGTMDGTVGSVPFTATTDAGASLPGDISVELVSENMINVKVVSSQGQTFFEGTMARDTSAQTDTTDGDAGDTTDDTPQETAAPSDSVYPESNVTLNLNGEELTFTDDIKPVIIDNFTYVPLRSVFTTMGINVYWDEYDKNSLYREQLITCTKDNTILQFSRTLNDDGANAWILRKWIDAGTNEKETTELDITDLQPKLIVRSSYIPLRIVSEAFGAEVEWDDEAKTVMMTCDTGNFNYNTPEEIATMEDYTLDAAREYITPDYSSIIPNSTPYFSPEGKFYLFHAQDQWNNVDLKIFYGGYIDVEVTDEPEPTQTPAAAATDAPVATEEPIVTDTPAVTDEPVVTEIPVQSEEPAVTPSPEPDTSASDEPTATPESTEAPTSTPTADAE